MKEAGELWIKEAEAALERGTLQQYRQHLDLHIAPFIGRTKLSHINVPRVREFESRLRDEGRSAVMVRKVIGSLGALLSDAQERGLIIRNPVREMRRKRRKGRHRQAERRQKAKLKVGTDIPTPEEIKAIVHRVEGRWRPLILTAIFTGLRASELRGLRWVDIDLEKRELHVRQRADRFNEIGWPKSEAGQRSVRLPPLVVNTLREWKLKCPKGELGLAFPNGKGGVEILRNIVRRGFGPAQIATSITIAKLDKKGKPTMDADGVPVMKPKYGMHALRHFYASWCINRKEDGGLGLPPKLVQERLGHSSITMTMDVYGHLFPGDDGGEEMAAAESALLS